MGPALSSGAAVETCSGFQLERAEYRSDLTPRERGKSVFLQRPSTSLRIKGRRVFGGNDEQGGLNLALVRRTRWVLPRDAGQR